MILSLASWGSRWAGGDRGVAVVDLDSGRRLDPVLVDRETGAPVGPATARMVRAKPARRRSR